MTSIHPTNGTVVIVGGGLAGATAAFELRERDFSGRIVLVSEEPTPPYERPPLSKGYLRGEQPLDKALVRPLADYEVRAIELLRERRAVTLDPARCRLGLDDGDDLRYDALIIATGAEPRRLDATRAYLPGVRYLRTVADADALRHESAGANGIVVIGGGWIGSEVAASLRQLDRPVTLITNLPRPLERVLGPEVSEVYRQVHEEHDVRLVHGRVARIEGDERAEGVHLGDGRRIGADLVVAGVGAVPRIELASRGGLETRDGAIVVDEHLRTSESNIWAAGDVALAFHPRYGRHLRVEHWDNAIRQGKTAAANALGTGEAYTRTPYFYSDQYELGMEYRGHAPTWSEVVVRGDVAARAFHAFWLDDGRVLAAMNVNQWDDAKALRRLVASDERVATDALADPSVPLESLA